MNRRGGKQVSRQLCRLLLVAGIIGFLVGCAVPPSPSPDDAFEREIGARIDPAVILVTDRLSYEPSGPDIFYWIVNRKTQPLYFQDQSLGMRIYKLDDRSNKWTLLRGAARIGNPHAVTIPARTTANLDTFPIALEDIRSTGMVRLVVIGWEDPQNPEGSKVAAYIDIELAPRQ